MLGYLFPPLIAAQLGTLERPQVAALLPGP